MVFSSSLGQSKATPLFEVTCLGSEMASTLLAEFSVLLVPDVKIHIFPQHKPYEYPTLHLCPLLLCFFDFKYYI